MTVVSRETVRDKLAELLTTALVGAGLPAQAGYGYPVGDFGNMAPVFTLAGGPIRRVLADTSGSCYRSKIVLYINTFVPYADPASGWTEADAEDALDRMEAAIAAVVLTNLNLAGYWSQLTYSPNEDTLPGSAVIGGVTYRWEIIPVMMEVFG